MPIAAIVPSFVALELCRRLQISIAVKFTEQDYPVPQVARMHDLPARPIAIAKQLDVAHPEILAAPPLLVNAAFV